MKGNKMNVIEHDDGTVDERAVLFECPVCCSPYPINDYNIKTLIVSGKNSRIDTFMTCPGCKTKISLDVQVSVA
jgi:hypothetical protein